MKTIRATGLAVAAALVLAGCATVQTPTRGDPLEGLNRTVFTFNDKVDQYAMLLHLPLVRVETGSICPAVPPAPARRIDQSLAGTQRVPTR
jgi:hypothetical protein